MSDAGEPEKPAPKPAPESVPKSAAEPGGTRRVPVLDKSDGDLDQSASAAAYEPFLTSAVPGRFWSGRRVPAALVALVVLGGSGLFLYDIAAVRAGQPAMHWRKALARELAHRPVDNVWVMVGAGAVAVLGLWLIVLAVTPGLRAVLPMRPTHDVRAGLHRAAAAMVLRDRAMEVSGVQSVRVRTRRHKVDVRAQSHFRPLDEVCADLDAVLADTIRSLGLGRPPALSVRVRRPSRKG
ncbi:DUF6286 domain-containing protein [Streptomyces sp. NPDC058001]|uniref:DUF6286 domain-containing protein n=1 Tax=Streptomyces sp. NPDC058001 TaxID=3346300 RepID=UPI0036E58543